MSASSEDGFLSNNERMMSPGIGRVPTMNSIRKDVYQEAMELTALLKRQGIGFKLLGGMAFKMICVSSSNGPFARTPVDIDMIIHRKDASAVSSLLKERGYSPRERFNALYGAKRLIFNDVDNGRRIDVFIDTFEMCHSFDFSSRIDREGVALSPADLLLTKLQIVQTSGRDYKDILSVLADFRVFNEDRDDAIDVNRISDICAEDWGIYRTVTDNLKKLLSTLDTFGIETGMRGSIVSAIETLLSGIEGRKKSLQWKMRSRVGTRVRWYVLPEEDREVVQSSVDERKQ